MTNFFYYDVKIEILFFSIYFFCQCHRWLCQSHSGNCQQLKSWCKTQVHTLWEAKFLCPRSQEALHQRDPQGEVRSCGTCWKKGSYKGDPHPEGTASIHPELLYHQAGVQTEGEVHGSNLLCNVLLHVPSLILQHLSRYFRKQKTQPLLFSQVYLDIKCASDPHIKLPIIILSHFSEAQMQSLSTNTAFEDFPNPSTQAWNNMPQPLDPPPSYSYAMASSSTYPDKHSSLM